MTVYASGGVEEDEVFEIADKEIHIGKMQSSSEGQETTPHEEVKIQTKDQDEHNLPSSVLFSQPVSGR